MKINYYLSNCQVVYIKDIAKGQCVMFYTEVSCLIQHAYYGLIQVLLQMNATVEPTT